MQQKGAAEKNTMGLLKMAAMLGKLKIDVVAYPLISKGGPELMAAQKEKLGTYQKHIKIGGYKMILDGSPQGRSAWMSQPYLNGDPLPPDKPRCNTFAFRCGLQRTCRKNCIFGLLSYCFIVYWFISSILYS